ncbi:MAG TPA: heparan-alpha-glucosaminide N-acetyltransferase domain-containing protein, partial [Holophagaceae bacterium]
MPEARTAVPRPRIHVLDFARLVAIFLMLQGHTLEAFVAPSAMDWTTLHWQLWGQIRGLTAPLFLLVSGAATVLATRRDATGRIPMGQVRHRLRTALWVGAIGYLMVFPAARLADLRWVTPEGWRIFLQVNILQLNAVTLALLTGLMLLTRSVRRHAAWSLAVGLAILLLAPWVAGRDWFAWLPESLAAYLSFAHGSLFPVFPASAFMFLGVGLGSVLVEAPETERLRWFRLAAFAAGLVALILSVASAQVPAHWFPPHDAYKAGWASAFHRLGFS